MNEMASFDNYSMRSRISNEERNRKADEHASENLFQHLKKLYTLWKKIAIIFSGIW